MGLSGCVSLTILILFAFSETNSQSDAPCGESDLVAGTETKTIKSPNYPSAYPVSLRCQWRIMKNVSELLTDQYPGRKIELEITDMDIPCDGDDYLQISRIRTGEIPNELALPFDTVRDCGNKLRQTFRISDALRILFNSDSINNGGHGFTLNYRLSNCNTTYTSDSGVIASDSFPSRSNSGYRCNTRITVSPGKTIGLYFRFLSLPFSPGVCHAHLKVYDGNSTSDPRLLGVCGSFIPNPVFSTGNSLYVTVYFPDVEVLYYMTYIASEKSGCGGSIIAQDGSFTSPGYPRPYNETGECVWHVSVPSYHTLKFQFHAFALNSTTGCEVNFVEIYDGNTMDISKRVVRYCGQDSPSTHQLSGSDGVVRFVSDTTNDKPGFILVFTDTGYVPPSSQAYLAQRTDDLQ